MNEEYIGVPGAHFVDHDEENENGELTKSIFWYSPDYFLSMVFTADKDSPDEFRLTETWAMPKAIEEDVEDPVSESEEKPTVAYSAETGMVELTGGVFVAFFNADAEHPDDFGLGLTEYHEQFK